MSDTPTCRWSDPGETCDNEATTAVIVKIGNVQFRFPSCEECAAGTET